MKKTAAATFRCYWSVLAGPILLLAPLLLSGQALFWGTPSLQFVAWWQQVWESLRAGALPLWNPLNGMGAPLIANYQLAFFYPPNWLLIAGAALGGAAGIAWVYTLLAALHLAWAGLGMALLLRRLGFPWLAQVLGGLSFGLSGYIVGRMGFFSMVWVWAWLPWVILFTHGLAASPAEERKALSGPRPAEPRSPEPRPSRHKPSPLSFGLLVSLAMMLLAGHAQLAWYSILLAGVWAAAAAWKAGGLGRVLSAWLRLALAGVLAAGIAAVQLVPTFEYLRVSHRSDAVAYETAMTYSFWPWRLLTLFSPDFFGSPAAGDFWGYATYWEDHAYPGLLPLLLAVATLAVALKGIRRARRSPRWGLVLLAWAALALTFVLAMGKYTPVFPFLYEHVPTFAMFQAPARYLIWFAFLVPLLAAVGVEHWRSPVKRGLYWFRLATAGAFAVALGAGLGLVFLKDVELSFIRATALTGLWGLGFGLLTLAIPWSQKAVEGPGLRAFLFSKPAPKAAKAPSGGAAAGGETPAKAGRKPLSALLFGWKQKPAEQAQAGPLPYAPADGPLRARPFTRAAAWQWAVILWAAVDLLAAGWGLNPGAHLAFYQGESSAKARYEQAAAAAVAAGIGEAASTPVAATDADAMTGSPRVYLSFWDEYDLKFNRFLRFHNFAPLEDWKNQRHVLLPNLNLLEGIPSANNFDPLIPGRYARWVDAVDSLPPSAREPWLALMGVGVVERVDVSQPDGARFDPLPGARRWRWFPCVIPADGEQQAWEIMQGRIHSAGSPWDAPVLENLPADAPAQCAASAAGLAASEAEQPTMRLIMERPDRLALAVDTQQDGWLFLADTWYPGWQSSVDGQPAEVYPANSAFRAVFVPAGRHEILFKLVPFGFYFGGLFSILILLLVMYLWTKWGRERT